MTDWSAYDPIADRYDEVWGARFDAVAKLVWRTVTPTAGARVLDVGTGTGIVPHSLDQSAPGLVLLSGCDRSLGMLHVARSRTRRLRVVAADATALPFRGDLFEVVTASFVMSHVADYRTAFAELRRVLEPGGRLAVTSWAEGEDQPSQVWSRLLTGTVSAAEVAAAFARFAPSMSEFETPARVERSLTQAGFVATRVETHAIESRLSPDQFIADRELTSSARYARHVLGPQEWDRLLQRAREALVDRFGHELTFSRGALIGVGRKA